MRSGRLKKIVFDFGGMENNFRGMGIGEEANSVEDEFERLAESVLAERGSMDGVLDSGNLRSFHDIAESSSVQSVLGVNLDVGLRDEPSSSTSSSVASERDNLDHDTHNKRPKVHTFSL